MFDRLGEAVHGAIEEIVGLVLSETGYREVLENSESEEEQERLANIEELLTAAREFDVQASRSEFAGAIPGRDVAGRRYRRLGDRDRPRHADDAARREGAGVSGGVHRRLRGGPVAARAQPAR